MQKMKRSCFSTRYKKSRLRVPEPASRLAIPPPPPPPGRVFHDLPSTYLAARRSLSGSSLKWPRPKLHLSHNSPLTRPVAWQWSTASALPTCCPAQIAHRPCCAVQSSRYSSAVSNPPCPTQVAVSNTTSCVSTLFSAEKHAGQSNLRLRGSSFSQRLQ